jgi:hypothetical protein
MARTSLAYDLFQRLLKLLDILLTIKGVLARISEAYKALWHLVTICEGRDGVKRLVIVP